MPLISGKPPISVADLAKLSTERLQEARLKCQTDLFWYADRILRNKKDPPLLDKVHGGICRTLVQKNPNIPLEDWSPIKQRVILSSRGTLKTVLEAADISQIILCAPDVRILLLSGKLDYAKSILSMVRGHFAGNEALMYLFPEFCEDVDGKSDEFLTSARGKDVNFREATVTIATAESVKAGCHVNWLKLDDFSNEINCATPILVEKLTQSYDDLDPLLEPGGYKDMSATRWAKDDTPEIIRQRGEEYKETDEYKETKIPQVLYFFQPIWTVNKGKNAQEQKEIDDREKKGKLHPADVTLLWPEKLNAKFLWPQYRANRKKFQAQYLLNPEAVSEDVHFTLQLLERQTRPINELPQPHRSAGCFINWDLAGIRSESGDYSVGLCGEWEYPAEQGTYGRLFIVDCVMEKFESSTEAAHAIVNFYKKHDPTRCRIEDAAGAKYCEGEILALAKSLGVNVQISWIPPETTKDAKIERVIDLVDVLKKDKIQFWSGLDHLQDLYNQFMKFSRKSKTKDDGPDCLAQLWKEYKGQIHPALIPRLQPSEVPIQWIPRESPDSEENQIDADELSAAQDNRFTMPHA